MKIERPAEPTRPAAQANRLRTCPEVPTDRYGVSQRLAQAAYGATFYPRAIVATSWSPLYERPSGLDPLEPRFAIAMVAFFAITGLLVVFRRRLPALLAAWLAYLVLLIARVGPHPGRDPARGRPLQLRCLHALPAPSWSGPRDRDPEATRVLEASLPPQRGHALAWYAVGLARAARGDLADAVAASEESVAADPSLPQGWRGRVVACLASGHRSEAEGALERGLAAVPNDPVLGDSPALGQRRAARAAVGPSGIEIFSGRMERENPARMSRSAR